MASANTLTPAEIGIVKTMLAFFPRLSRQAILSYFTRPGRDLNHRLITEIMNGRWSDVPAATVPAALAYMSAFTFLQFPRADDFNGTIVPAVSQSKTIAALELNWWPVGQGLFHSGRLRSPNAGFSWVYDCGSSSGAKVRNAAVSAYRRTHGNRVNLVTLSHFDADHINGIEALIRGIRVDTLLLPYLPLWERLLLAISEGLTPRDKVLGFFIDPVAYLTGIDGSDIGEIVFVPAAGPDDAAPAADDGTPPEPDMPMDPPKMDKGEPPPDFEDDCFSLGPGQASVRFLRPGGRITIPSLWEFVPYNDAELRPHATASFQRRASRIARVFIANPARRDRALKVLKRIYDDTFGGGSKPRNLASLFLYSGPVGTRIRVTQLWSSADFQFDESRDNFAQLCTGDGYLESANRLDALRGFYRNDRRFDRVGIFQVMHHGAKGNWHLGVADAVRPAVSIFSSDPEHKSLGHPHAEVLRDFWRWSPVQVDKDHSFQLLAILAR